MNNGPYSLTILYCFLINYRSANSSILLFLVCLPCNPNSDLWYYVTLKSDKRYFLHLALNVYLCHDRPNI